MSDETKGIRNQLPGCADCAPCTPEKLKGYATPAPRVSNEDYPGPLDGVWPEELRDAMLLIETEVERAFTYSREKRSLAAQGRVTDAFTQLKAYMRKARAALRAPAPSEAVVERGARALFADSHPGESWDQTTDVYRDYHRSTARLILTAALTPDAEGGA